MNKLRTMCFALFGFLVGTFSLTSSASAEDCPESIWSGAKRAPSDWNETQSKVDGPERRQSGTRVECHYDNINDTVYIWRNDPLPDAVECPDSIWTGAKRAPSTWRETQSKVSGADKRVNGSRVECHYPNKPSVYIWQTEEVADEPEVPDCPSSIWSGAKRAPTGWKETQEKVDSPSQRVSGNRVECHYDNGNDTVYIWRTDPAPAGISCPDSLWTGAKRAPSPWRETQTLVNGADKRVNGARIECHYDKPDSVYIWQNF